MEKEKFIVTIYITENTIRNEEMTEEEIMKHMPIWLHHYYLVKITAKGYK